MALNNPYGSLSPSGVWPHLSAPLRRWGSALNPYNPATAAISSVHKTAELSIDLFYFHAVKSRRDHTASMFLVHNSPL